MSLQGDFFNFLLRRKADIWAIGNPDRDAVWKMELDAPAYSNSLLHDAALHILSQKRKFDYWIESTSPDVAANALLILCVKLNKMLQSQLKGLLEQFRHHGGFTENMTVERLEARRATSANTGTPICPKCGKPMFRRMQNKGQHQGREFWGCSNYPHCNGTRPISSK